ncbi:MAG: GGDEF domain-containing protein [Ilumatobacter sp.]|nr:GGDEF domain-containing protein [Ilumatobacter sp.]
MVSRRSAFLLAAATIVTTGVSHVDAADRPPVVATPDLLEDLARADVSFSEPVYIALEPLPRTDRMRLDDGQTISLGEDTYLHAIDHLLHHAGRAPLQRRPGPSLEATAAAIAAYVDRGVFAPQAPGAAEPPGGAIDVPYGRGDRHDDGPALWQMLGVAALAGAAGWYLATRRRRSRSSGRRAGDLLEAGRSFATAQTVADVERLAAERALALTDAETAGYVRVTRDGFELATSIGLDRIDVAHASSSIVARTVLTGREISIVANDPMIGTRRSLLAAPAVAAGHAAGVIVLTRRPGRPFSAESVETLAALRPLVGAALDAAMSRELIHTEAYQDALTQLRNRRALDETLAMASGRLLVLMVDVDHFKLVNDVHGHPAGDTALRTVAATIEEAVGDRGSVYRYGGEEFAVVLDTGDSAALGCVGERIRSAVEANPIDIGDAVLNLTVSVGTAWGEDPIETIARADIALYEAKRSGRNRVVAAPGRLVEQADVAGV